MNRQTREELNALSQEVFGASSRWQKLLNKGYSKLVTVEVLETVPSEKEGEEPQTVKVTRPVLLNGVPQSTQERHTEESIREAMLDLKQKRDEYLATVKRLKEEKEARQAALNKVQSSGTGVAGV